MSNINRTLLVSESTLKDNSILQDNVDMKMIQPNITLVQDMYLQPLLGTKLYREIQRQVYEDDFKQDYYDLLVDYIEPVIVYGVLSEVPSDLLLKMMNLTVGNTTDEQVTAATLRQVNYLKEQNKNKMEFYAKRMDDYICWNTDKFPEFLENVEDDMRPSYRAYTSNIAMPSYNPMERKGQLRYNDFVYDILNKRVR